MHAFERPYKRQIVTDTKSRHASHIVNLSSMGKACAKHISTFKKKIVENMFFLDGEHLRLGEMLPKIERKQVPYPPPPQRVSPIV